MEEKKLISIRVDADTLAAIDDFCKLRRYWKRSTVINTILGNLVSYANSDDFCRLATHWRGQILKLDISVKYSSK